MKSFNLEQVCENFTDLFKMLREDTSTLPVVTAGGSALHGINYARCLQLRYHAQRRDTPVIGFFEPEEVVV